MHQPRVNRILQLTDRSSLLERHGRRAVFSIAPDGSGRISLYYGAKVRGDILLNREDWTHLRDLLVIGPELPGYIQTP